MADSLVRRLKDKYTFYAQLVRPLFARLILLMISRSLVFLVAASSRQLIGTPCLLGIRTLFCRCGTNMKLCPRASRPSFGSSPASSSSSFSSPSIWGPRGSSRRWPSMPGASGVSLFFFGAFSCGVSLEHAADPCHGARAAMPLGWAVVVSPAALEKELAEADSDSTGALSKKRL